MYHADNGSGLLQTGFLRTILFINQSLSIGQFCNRI